MDNGLVLRHGATKLNLGGLRVEFTDLGPTMVVQRARIFLIRPSRLAKWYKKIYLGEKVGGGASGGFCFIIVRSKSVINSNG